ncbi:MAG TPA: tetratricopeptide repeat protein [Methylophilaceae bacterium]|nr:tetratricopeptide repeat protein [Methylophilaceae bacterium]
MALDLEEQDQLDALKTWWKVYGNLITAVVVVFAVGFAGYRGWEYYQHQQSIQASAKYEALGLLNKTDIKAVKSITAELMDKYPSTPYAGRAAIAAAQSNYLTRDIKSAKAQLEWAVKNAKEDAVRAVALLQLAALQAEEKDFDAALKTLAEKHDAGFDGLFADLKGDVLAAQGKNAEARLAYQDALSKLDAQGRYHRYTEYKLEALGS